MAVILEATSVADARERMARLPMVEAGLIDFDYTVLGPFRQLEVLFAGGNS